MLIREAVPSDLEAITAIYNDIVRSSTAIYNDQPVTVEDRSAWWQDRLAAGYPVLVAQAGQQTAVAAEHSTASGLSPEAILGFASFGDFRPWPGYRFTVEGTIHLRPEARRRGVGRQLLDELVRRARALGKHVLVAGVDAENEASQRFLTAYGFQVAGRLREVGFKFDRFLDLVFLQYMLTVPQPARMDDLGGTGTRNLKP